VCHTIGWFAASIVTGVLLAKLIEVPVMRVRERLFPPAVAVEHREPHRARRYGDAVFTDPDPA
jgi:hypothetical protein